MIIIVELCTLVTILHDDFHHSHRIRKKYPIIIVEIYTNRFATKLFVI